MKERPILFSGPMVRALLAGSKVQTRRLVPRRFNVCDACWAGAVPHNGTEAAFGGPCYLRVSGCDHEGGTGYCGGRERPRFDVGDTLWVRETWGFRGTLWRGDKPDQHEVHIDYQADTARRTFVRADNDRSGLPKQICRCSGEGTEEEQRLEHDEELTRYWRSWRPSIFLPRWASRIILEITEVRVERLQDISEENARAEGVEPAKITVTMGGEPPSSGCGSGWTGGGALSARQTFALLWDSINGSRATWASNPWVWCLSFHRVEATP